MSAVDASRPLPRGPHDLSRAEVEESQRQRMLLAMADAVAEKGYVRTTVADVLSRAGVSRATFYAQFSDKEDCFRAAFESIANLLAEVLAAQSRMLDETDGEAADPMAKLDLLLTSYLQLLHDAPSFAKTFLIEVYAAGPKAIEQRRRSLEGFVTLVAETHRGLPGLIGTDPSQRFAVQALIGAVGSLVTNLVGAGDFEGILELREPLLELVHLMKQGSPT